MSTADLGYPILAFIIIFWGLFAIAAVLTALVKKGRLPGSMKRIFHKSHKGSGHDDHRSGAY
jgi:hypothetical protein